MVQANKPVHFVVKAFLGFVFMCLVIASFNMSYDDELTEQDEYCTNVAEKIWPDYKGLFATECKKPQK